MRRGLSSGKMMRMKSTLLHVKIIQKPEFQSPPLKHKKRQHTWQRDTNKKIISPGYHETLVRTTFKLSG